GFKFTDTAAGVLTGKLGRAAGETVAGSPYGITLGTLAADANYTINFTPHHLDITPAILTVITAREVKVYGDPEPTVLTLQAKGFQGTDNAASVLTGKLQRAAGETVAGSPYASGQWAR